MNRAILLGLWNINSRAAFASPLELSRWLGIPW